MDKEHVKLYDPFRSRRVVFNNVCDVNEEAELACFLQAFVYKK